MPPKVSICIPTYKQIEYLRKTLDSVLLQHFQDYEVVVTDDSPDDSVKNLIGTYNFDGKLKYYKNEKNLGSPENWNEAVRRASGEYIKMLHHDDYFTFANSLEKFVDMLDTHPNIEIAFSAAIAINVSSSKQWLHCPTERQIQTLRSDPKCLFFGNFVGPPSSTIYRSKLKLKYDINLKWLVDLDFYISCLTANNKFAFSRDALITSISGALHNVTNDCENNKGVEIFEYLHVYKKINHGLVFVQYKYLYFFKMMFSKYNINSIKEIKYLGYEQQLPLFLQILILLRKIKNDILKKNKQFIFK